MTHDELDAIERTLRTALPHGVHRGWLDILFTAARLGIASQALANAARPFTIEWSEACYWHHAGFKEWQALVKALAAYRAATEDKP